MEDGYGYGYMIVRNGLVRGWRRRMDMSCYWCREVWKGGFVGMSDLKDIGMRALSPFALDWDCVLMLSSDALKI